MAMPVGVVPAANGLPGTLVSTPDALTEKPEIVPCAGQPAGVVGGVAVLGGEVVTTTELVFETNA
jgi:hypothetical protein